MHHSLNYYIKLTVCFMSLGISPIVLGESSFMQLSEYDEKCYGTIPEYVAPQKGEDIKKIPISITADSMNSDVKSNINYHGDVEIIQGNKKLHADTTTFNQQTQEMTANGNILYQDGEITVNSNHSLHTNLITNTTELNNANYQINGTVVRGNTRKALLNNETKTISLYDASVTTCPENQESWSLSSSEININQNEVFGEAYHTVFRLNNVPVMYLPYFNFPIKNQRKSGFLYPTLEYTSTDGGMFTIPVYWNIAPNYDFTYSPKIITRRGILNTGEFRYMPFRDTTGTIYAQYINHDRHKPSSEYEEKYDERWLIHWSHSSYFDNHDYGLRVDYNKIRKKDYNYVNDLDPKIDNVVDNQLPQTAFAYIDKHIFDARVSVNDYQLLVPYAYVKTPPFRLLPRVEMKIHDEIGSYLSYLGHFEYSRFDINSSEGKDQRYTGERYHFQPELLIPLINSNGAELKWTLRGFLTHYNQDIPSSLYYKYTEKGFTPALLDESVNRYLYDTELYSKATFINQLQNYTLTLEPELQYTYLPYKKQDSIAIYDSTDRVYDYHSLFSYQKYAGIDRIADINRVSYGITYRMFDNDLSEVFRFNIGQGYDFHSQKVHFYPADTSNTYQRTPIATGLNISFNEYIGTNAGAVYNTQKGETSSWNAQLNGMYKDFKGHINYRYIRDGNRTQNVFLSDSDLKQLGGTINFPITENVKGIAAMYYDVERSKNIDQKLALKYESCCYSVGIQLERYRKPDNFTMSAEQETKYGFFFELKGLTESGMTTSFSQETKLIPYNDAVNLNR